MENNTDFLESLEKICINYANKRYMCYLNGFFINDNNLLMSNFLKAAFKSINMFDYDKKKQLLTIYTLLSI